MRYPGKLIDRHCCLISSLERIVWLKSLIKHVKCNKRTQQTAVYKKFFFVDCPKMEFVELVDMSSPKTIFVN